FIQSNLTKIYNAHRDILQCYSVDGKWPSDTDVNLITQRADGQYVYPVTLLKYIDNDDENPHDRLQACLEQVPEALSPIDMLYLGILRSSHKPNNEEIQDILFLICCNFQGTGFRFAQAPRTPWASQASQDVQAARNAQPTRAGSISVKVFTGLLYPDE